MTCRVLVLAPDGLSVEARILLDSASSPSFASERLAQTLRLPRSTQSFKISGIAGISHQSPYRHVQQIPLELLDQARDTGIYEDIWSAKFRLTACYRPPQLKRTGYPYRSKTTLQVRLTLSRHTILPDSSCLLTLHPFLDSFGLLRVGGRERTILQSTASHLTWKDLVMWLLIHVLLYAGPQLGTWSSFPNCRISPGHPFYNPWMCDP
jgi:hypothetical protein